MRQAFGSQWFSGQPPNAEMRTYAQFEPRHLPGIAART